jgi:integrase
LSSKFSVSREKTDFVTLDKAEIEMIRQFSGADYLENARDWLIIGCWTACRVNDLMNLTEDNLQINKEGQRFIRYTQSKTGQTVDIPLYWHVEEILDRLGGFPRPISDVKFNVYIKEVCKRSGLLTEVFGSRQNPTTHRKETGMFPKWQLVRSHICRRSFATNYYKALPNKVIMRVTGHTTEKMLLNYIGEVENDHFEDFLSVWNNEREQQPKTLNIANLK